ncbi:MAG: hypothetical protein O3A63_13140 [Proteobacteria bacterium]|nr:hypothetical protein [Pseudomonadota bacterium]
MADIIPFKRPDLKNKAKGKTLCLNGFHKWVIDQKKQFDSRQGRLVTIRHCIRCGEKRVDLA